MLGLLKDPINTLGCFRAKMSLISVMTADVAVAVTATTGTPGYSCRRFASAKYWGLQQCMHIFMICSDMLEDRLLVLPKVVSPLRDAVSFIYGK